MNYFDSIIANKLFGSGSSPVPPTPTPSSDELYDVMFYDYDGTVLNHYTKDEFLALTEMPDNPTREGLTAQGWNWTLADAKEYVRDHGIIDIGQLYVTDDGATRLHISMNEATGKVFTLIFYCSVANSVIVNWGDGSPTVTPSSGTGVNHEYADYGDYVISLAPQGDTQFGTYGTYPFGGDNASRDMITEINFGNNVVADRIFLRNLYEVTIITMPNITYSSGTTIPNISGNRRLSHMNFPPSFGANTPYNNFSTSMTAAKHVCFPKNASIQSFPESSLFVRACLPDTITTLTNMYVASKVGLKQVALPSNLQGIDASALQGSYSLEEITIPATVASIGANAIDCLSMKKIYVLPETPPTLSSSSTFVDLSKHCTIYVPASSLETYKSATNWSVLASQMVGM